MKKKVLIVIGTRPEAIKLAPVVKALAAHPATFDVQVCLTAQHRELLDSVLNTFQLTIHYDLNLMRPDQTLGGLTAAVLGAVDGVIAEARPDWVLVQGDTTTTFATALAAVYRRTRVGHIEAGLRSGDKGHPYPEEYNRRLTSVLADVHYAPTPRARAALLTEGIKAVDIVVTGNTVIDALIATACRPFRFAEPSLEALGTQRKLLLVTAHRRESFGDPFRDMLRAIRDIVRSSADLEAVYPVHLNPHVRRVAEEVLGGEPRVHLIEPLDYLPFVHLMRRAWLILTDSGGIQEEAPALGKPVLVMRERTERPEAIEAGTARLVGVCHEGIVNAVSELLQNPDAYESMARAVNPFGDGDAAKRIAEDLARR